MKPLLKISPCGFDLSAASLTSNGTTYSNPSMPLKLFGMRQVSLWSGLPPTSTYINTKFTSSVEPFVDIISIPWWVNMFLFRESVDGEWELSFSPFEFFLCRSGLDPWVPTQKKPKEGTCNEDFTSDWIGASEVGWDFKEVVHDYVWVIIMISLWNKLVYKLNQ